MAEPPTSKNRPATSGVNRRRFLKSAGIGAAAGGALWVAPEILGAEFAFAAGSNGPNWVLQSSAVSPPARIYHGMATDSAGNVVLFGGVGDNTDTLAGTWVWNSTTWIQQTPANTPLGRYTFAMGYDVAAGDVVLFGGFNSASGYLADAWVWS